LAAGGRRGLGHLGLDLTLQVDAGHFGAGQQVDRDIGEFFAYVITALAPRVECFGDLALEEADSLGVQQPINRAFSRSGSSR
jgi:hypothetical protein